MIYLRCTVYKQVCIIISWTCVVRIDSCIRVSWLPVRIDSCPQQVFPSRRSPPLLSLLECLLFSLIALVCLIGLNPTSLPSAIWNELFHPSTISNQLSLLSLFRVRLSGPASFCVRRCDCTRRYVFNFARTYTLHNRPTYKRTPTFDSLTTSEGWKKFHPFDLRSQLVGP